MIPQVRVFPNELVPSPPPPISHGQPDRNTAASENTEDTHITHPNLIDQSSIRHSSGPEPDDRISNLETPPSTYDSPHLEEELNRWGPYLLIEKIGEGGFGEVWRARQERPVRREVALKLLKPLRGISDEAVARFRAEAQAMALMDHPNIARIYDAGQLEDGRLYFAMELVGSFGKNEKWCSGVPLTKYCNARQMGLRERLETFGIVCRAVAGAHQKGIIHRDLKPGNILVGEADGKAVPKVIDFGLAKDITGADVLNLTKHTVEVLGTPMGTIQFMAPEQATGAAVDTRTDVYALGAVLYELLTGSPPLDEEVIRGAAFDEIIRMVREADVPKPSLRVAELKEPIRTATATERHYSDYRRFVAALRGDLDWITLMALDKEPTRRHAGVIQLGEDVEAYVAGNALPHAAPPSRTYRIKKFVQRHRMPVVASMLVMLTLIGGVTVSTWQAMRAKRAEAAAIVEKTNAVRERGAAEKARVEAEEATGREIEARDAAIRAEKGTRARLYAADMVAAQHSLSVGDLGSARQYLNAYRTFDVLEDLRGFAWRYFWHQSHGDEIYSFEGHENNVSSLAFSSDRKLLASGDWDGLVIIWDVERRNELARIKADGGKIVSLDFQMDRKLLAVGAASMISVFTIAKDGSPNIWRRHSPTRRPNLTFLTGTSTLLIGEGSNRFGYEGGEARIWNYNTERTELVLKNSGGKVAVSGDHTTAFTSLQDKRIRKWDLATGKLTDSVVIGDRVSAMASSQDGRWLVIGASRPGYMSVAELRSGITLEPVRGLSSHRGSHPFECFAFSTHGAFAGACTIDQVVRVWDIGKADPPRILKGHGGQIRACEFSIDGELLATGGDDNTVKIWNPQRPDSKSQFVEINCRQWALDPIMSPDGSTLVARGLDGEVVVWDTETKSTLKKLEESYHPLGFINEGQVLVTTGKRSTVFYYDAVTFELLSKKTIPHEEIAGAGRKSAISPDGKYLLFGGIGGNISVWDLDQGRLIVDSNLGRGSFFDIQFLPDGKHVLSSHIQYCGLVWNLESGDIVKEFKHDREVYTAAVSPDGRIVATGSLDTTIGIWDAESGARITTLAGHKRGLLKVRFSPDGSTLASTGHGLAVHLWDTRTWREVARIPFKEQVTHLTFAQDSSVLAAVEVGGNRSRLHLLQAPESIDKEEHLALPNELNPQSPTTEKTLLAIEAIRARLPLLRKAGESQELAQQLRLLARLEQKARCATWKEKLAEAEAIHFRLSKDARPDNRSQSIEPAHTINHAWVAAWASNGKSITFNLTNAKEKLLSTVDLSTGMQIGEPRTGWDPASSPVNPNRLVAAIKKDGRDGIFLIPKKGEPRFLAEGTYPSWSGDGQHIFFFHLPSREIRAIDMSELGNEVKVTTISTCKTSIYPSVSPDGSNVAYGMNDKLVVIEIETGKIVAAVPTLSWRGILAGWSPDCRYVSFGSYASAPPRGLWMLNVTTGESRQILEGNLTLPRWSPDGTMIACDDRANYQIKIYRVSDLELP